MFFSDTNYQPATFPLYKKLWIIIQTLKHPSALIVDRLGIRKLIIYRTRNGIRFLSRSKTTDINEAIVVLSGKEYSEDLLDISSQNNPVVVDAGGNIGFFCLYINKLNPSAKIITIEPYAENIVLLQKNLSLNGLQDVVIVPLALSNSSGTSRFEVKEYHFDGGRITDDESTSNTFIETTTLEVIFDTYKIGNVDLLKMDIEGSEFDVIQASLDLLSKRVRRIVIEYHASVKADGRDFLVESLQASTFKLIYESKNILGFHNLLYK